jgi:hypothetical protein
MCEVSASKNEGKRQPDWFSIPANNSSLSIPSFYLFANAAHYFLYIPCLLSCPCCPLLTHLVLCHCCASCLAAPQEGGCVFCFYLSTARGAPDEPTYKPADYLALLLLGLSLLIYGLLLAGCARR